MRPGSSRWRRVSAWVLSGVAALAVIIAITIVVSPGLRWRAMVARNFVLGRSEDIGWLELVRMLKPGSGFWLFNMSENPNPYAAIQNPFVSAADLAEGRLLFVEHCASCHGHDGMGSDTGIRLVGHSPRHGRSPWAIYRTVRYGIPGTPMVARPALAWNSTWRIVAHVETLLRNAAAAPVPESLLAGMRGVNPADIPASGGAHEDWLTYSGSYDGTRFSTLDQVTSANARSLRVAWIVQLPSPTTRVETSPIVRDGVMFISEPPAGVRALDASTGRTLWHWSRDLPTDLSVCCWVTNRGVAIMGERVFVATMDAHLVALDARSGAVLWDKTVAEHAGGYSITAAPLAYADLVITGMAGGEFQTRGFIDAYDAATGERRWRFWTLPGAGEPGAETWAVEPGRRFGGPTWLTGSLDPELKLLYWGVGNPTPPFNGVGRPGDNLYTNSMVALDLATGKLRWHFQFTPHDEHDWDAVHVPVLVNVAEGGSQAKLLANANRNGFYYLLDRATGQFRFGTPFARQTWAEGLTPEGRPIEIPGQRPSKEGTLTYPSSAGATNWWSPSYSPRTGLYYVPFFDNGRIFFRGDESRVAGDTGMIMGSSEMGQPGWTLASGIRALDLRTGGVVWEYRSAPRSEEAGSGVGGVLSTAGGVVFSGEETTFYALDAGNGTKLLALPLGGWIAAAPVSYQVAGRQYVAIAAGRAVVAFSLMD